MSRRSGFLHVAVVSVAVATCLSSAGDAKARGFLKDFQYVSVSGTLPGEWAGDFSDGREATVALGKWFYFPYMEMELGYRSNSAASVSAASGGRYRAKTAMVNFLGNPFIWEGEDARHIGGLPFFWGFGFGLADIQASGISFPGQAPVSDRQLSPAVQAMAGVRFPTGKIGGRETFGTFQYRYFHLPGFDLTSGSGNSLGADYASHGIRLGFMFLLR
ncbi:MAG: hypothetical protein AB7N54_17920 [Alphaproteobacteria bacterium]